MRRPRDQRMFRELVRDDTPDDSGTPAAAGGAGSNGGLAESVRRAQRGDADAFRVIYRTVQPGLFRYVTSLVGDDAEEVASETWAQIVRDLVTFDGDGDGFRGWAATIARNRCLDHLRRLRRRPVGSLPIDEFVDQPSWDDTAAMADGAIQTRAALALITSLPSDQAEAVLLRVVMGLSVEQAARVLGKRSGAVRVAAHRGLRRLAQHLLDHQGLQPAVQQSTGKEAEPR